MSIIRTGYRGEVRAKWFYLDWFGELIEVRSIREGFALAEHLLGLDLVTRRSNA